MGKHKKVTLNTVAEHANVSYHIARDVLSGRSNQKTTRNLKVIAVAEKLGYLCKAVRAKGSPSCPNCEGIKFVVKESRKSDEAWLRIRECQNCKTRFMTSETIVNERNYLQ